MKILIVDDSRASRRIVVDTIGEAGFSGHEIMEAGGGEEALDLVHAEFPDLILSSWEVSGRAGLDLLRSLDGEGYAIPCGFIAAEATDAMLAEARDTGAIFMLVKPFTASDMAEALGVVISPVV